MFKLKSSTKSSPRLIEPPIAIMPSHWPALVLVSVQIVDLGSQVSDLASLPLAETRQSPRSVFGQQAGSFERAGYRSR
jgi:hypothetical protein